jgi:DNA invertase Pin-like site-specific DNA recombinase
LPIPDELIPGIDTRVTQVTAATEVSSENQKAGWKNKFKKIFKKGNKDKNEINPDIQKLASSGALGDASAKTAMEENASVITGNLSSS